MAEKTAGQVAQGNFKIGLKKYVDSNPLEFSEDAITQIKENMHVED